MGEQQGGGERVWVLDPDPITGRVDQDELAQKMIDAAVVVGTVGGILTIAPDRVPVPGRRGQFETRSVLFRWHSYVPTAKVAEPHPQEVLDDPLPEDLEEHLEQQALLSDEEAAALGQPVELEA